MGRGPTHGTPVSWKKEGNLIPAPNHEVTDDRGFPVCGSWLRFPGGSSSRKIVALLVPPPSHVPFWGNERCEPTEGSGSPWDGATTAQASGAPYVRASATPIHRLIEPGQKRTEHHQHLLVRRLDQRLGQPPRLVPQRRLRVRRGRDRQQVGHDSTERPGQPIDEINPRRSPASFKPPDVRRCDVSVPGKLGLGHPPRMTQFPQPGGEEPHNL